MQELKEKYKEIIVRYTAGEPIMEEKDGALVVKQTEESKVEMTDEQLSSIIVICSNIRNKLISGN